MALQSSEVLPDNTLEEFRIEFNKLITDVSGLSLGNTFSTQIIFEGDTDDNFETGISVTDPTADRSIVFPDASGNVLLDSVNIALGDDIELQFGTGTDLKIYHDGSHSYIEDAGTGNLKIQGSQVDIIGSGETMATFVDDGAVTLYHNNVAKLASSAAGVDVTGSFTISAGGTVGIPTDTDLLTLTSGVLTVAGEVSMTTLDIGGTNITTTAAELNLIDGGATIGTTAVVDADGILHNDGGAMKVTSAATFKTYFQEGISQAYDDFTIGDAAVLITTSSGNITIDAAANDSDIIFKGTDGGADTTYLTIDGSAAGAATFNAGVIATTGTFSGIASVDDTTDTSSGTTGSIHTDGGLGIAKKLFVGTNATVAGTTLMTGVATHGGNVVSDTDSTDDLGTTGVRWANLYVDAITATDQITATGFTGTLDGILGSGAAAAATTTTLASTTITAGGIVKTDDTTDATSTTDGSLQTDGGLSVALDAVLGNDVKLLSDASVLSFGGNSEVTLTHVHNDGLLLNDDMQLQFRDSAINIRSDADGDLDINADDEIELNSTLIDINGNIDASGTYTGAGLMTTGGNIVIPDGGNIGVASDTNAMSISSIGIVSLTATNAMKLNVGTTAQRPTGAAGLIRYNTTTSGFEGYGAAWGALGGGATGGGSDTVFIENQDDVTADYTITTGSNALSVGPITVATGVTVTVPTGNRWLVL